MNDGSFSVKLEIIPRAALTERQAAVHCGMSLASFKAYCPVQPVAFPDGKSRWLTDDLSGWMQSLKSTDNGSVNDDVIGRLE